MHSKFIESAVIVQSPDEIDIPGLFIDPIESSGDSVIMLHGITTHKDEFANFHADLAHRLADSGVASLRIDFRGHGDSPVSSRLFTIASQLVDATAAYNWLSKKNTLHRIHLIGTSFGAPPSIFLATRTAIATLNLISPVLDYDATFLHPSTEWASEFFNKRTIETAFRSGFLCMEDGFQIDVKLLSEMEIVRPYQFLSTLTASTLIIHGDADSMVPYSLSEKYSLMAAQKVQLLGFPHMEHGFYDADDETGASQKSRQNFESIYKAIIAHIRCAK